MKDRAPKTMTYGALRKVANAASRERFGVSADRLTGKFTSGSTGRSAEARRLAAIARYTKK
jgi:hypothetical protein